MTRKTFTATTDMIGKYINRYLYTDAYPIGKIVGIKSKTILLVQPVEATENKVKMEFAVGGFSAVCLNQCEQQYDFIEVGEVFEMKMRANDRQIGITDKPYKYYDYNF